jgi:hypothetical protein
MEVEWGRGFRRTDKNGPNERVVEDPSDGDIGDAHTAMAVADSSQYGKQSLEEGPVSPHSGDRVQILSLFPKERHPKREGRRGTSAG